MTLIEQNKLIDHVVEVLNEINRADPTVLPKLIALRVPTNQTLAEHPTVQVHAYDSPDKYSVGILGILNGIVGSGEFGPICAIVETDGSISSFKKAEAGKDGRED